MEDEVALCGSRGCVWGFGRYRGREMIDFKVTYKVGLARLAPFSIKVTLTLLNLEPDEPR
jgi:hypothetical protein